MIARDLDRPLSPSVTVREGRDAYLRENGFTVASYDEPRVRLSFFALSFVVPNPVSRRKAVRFHDLHHVVTGYGTDLVGEGEISAWELRRGFGGLSWYTRALVLSAIAIGVVIAPRRMLRAWKRGAGPSNLFSYEHRYEDLLEMSVGDLRDLLLRRLVQAQPHEAPALARHLEGVVGGDLGLPLPVDVDGAVDDRRRRVPAGRLPAGRPGRAWTPGRRNPQRAVVGIRGAHRSLLVDTPA